jgi:prepilin-type N-terminal cleavage/methylation domain-containing protein
MPISTTAPTERRGLGNDAGFTLLEIALVVLIISVVLGLTIPRLRDRGHAELNAQAHHLELTFRLLRSEAALNGYAYRLNYDLDQQRYWVTPHEQASVDLAQFAADMGKLARGTRLNGDVLLTDVALPTLAGKVAQGQIFTVFYPDGSVDPTIIHLATPREAYTLWFEPMHGRLKGREGYFDPSYGD